MEDRRMFERIKTRSALRVLDTVSGSEGRAETVDISAGGIGFHTEMSLCSNDSLQLWMQVPGRQEGFYTRAKVAWAKPQEEADGQRVGVRFNKPELMSLARVL